MTVETLTPNAAADLIAATNIDLVDVRDEREYAGGHVAGARNIPLETLRADPERFLSHDKPVLLVCAKGVRSLSAAKLLERLGWAGIYNLDGGTSAWAKAGYPLQAEALRTAA